MSQATPSGIGPQFSGIQPSAAGSSLSSNLSDAPYDGPSICTADDPMGVRHNGTHGRVYSESVRADNSTPAERAQSRAAFQQQQICDDGVLGAIACDQPFLEVESASVEVSGGGMSVGAEASSEGVKGTASVPLGGGMSANADGTMTYEAGGSELPKIKAGLCIALKGSKKPEKEVRVEASAGVVGAGTNGQDLCLFAQTPAPLGASVTFPVQP
jgi:hypothetical protein